MVKILSRFCERDPLAHSVSFEGVRSVTHQSFHDESHLPTIVDRYLKTGVLPQSSRRPVYGDFSSEATVADNLVLLEEARSVYESLPPVVYRKFSSFDDYLNFITDPRTRADAVALGLLSSPDSPSPQAAGAEPHNEAAPPTDAGVVK